MLDSKMKVFHHQTLTVVLCGRLTDGFTSLTNNELPHRKHKLRTALNAAPEGMKWFVKTETFAKPYPEVKQYLEEHREWVRSLREKGSVSIASGYRVDENGRPGGGGLVSILLCTRHSITTYLSIYNLSTSHHIFATDDICSFRLHHGRKVCKNRPFGFE